MLITVVCDKCGWERRNQIISDWINRLCPSCWNSIPVGRDDVKVYRFLRAVQIISNIIKFFCPWVKTKDIHVSSKDTRKV